jgi:hypothetical protein
MKITDEQILERAVSEFNEKFPAKFREGMRKYSSPLAEKDCIAEAKQEIYDLWAYLTAEEMRREQAHKIAIDLWERRDHKMTDDKWEALFNLLEPKKLAQKKTPPIGEASVQTELNVSTQSQTHLVL